MLFSQSSLLNWPPQTLWEASVASVVFGLLGIALAILGCTFVGVWLLRWPLTVVMLVLAPISIALSWRLRW